MVSVADVLAGHVPEPARGRTRLILYDDAIDKLGHDDELEGMGASTITERYKSPPACAPLMMMAGKGSASASWPRCNRGSMRAKIWT